MPRTPCRIRHVTNGACLRTGTAWAAKPRTPVTFDLRQEPGAGKPHAGICAGAGRNPCPYRDSRERIDWDADAVVISGRRNGGARHRERMSGPAWSKTLACMQAPRPETGRPPALAARELSGPHREGEEPKPLTRGAVQTLHLT